MYLRGWAEVDSALHETQWLNQLIVDAIVRGDLASIHFFSTRLFL